MAYKFIFNLFLLLFVFSGNLLISAEKNTGPNRLMANYVNGNNAEKITAIEVDSEGNIIVAGSTNSTAQLISSATHQSEYGGGESDVFIIKYAENGDIIWSTYFGGAQLDEAYSMKITDDDKIILCGLTNSQTKIASNGFQNNLAGASDGFIACFSKDGALEWASYFGGVNNDKANDIAIDNEGNVIIAGISDSPDLATLGVFKEEFGPKTDAFILKLSKDAETQWITYFGGDGSDTCSSVTTDNDNNIIIGGWTDSKTGISSEGAFQTKKSLKLDAFIASFDGYGKRNWSTYAGGYKDDYIHDMDCDNNKNILIAGYSYSNEGIATEDAFQGSFSKDNGGATILKYNSDGAKLYGSHYSFIKMSGYGEGPHTDLKSIICDNSNCYIIAGTTVEKAMATKNAWQAGTGEMPDAFIVKFNEAHKRMWATYYGGEDIDSVFSLCFDNDNNIYFGGVTSSASSISQSNNISTPPDAFFAKLSGAGNIEFTVDMNRNTYFPLNVTLMQKNEDDVFEVLGEQKLKNNKNDTVAFEIGTREGPFKIVILPLDTMRYSRFEYQISNRDEMIQLESVSAEFHRANSLPDSNSTSSISFNYESNGLFGHNPSKRIGSLVWPRGLDNLYIFGAGPWFGVRKRSDGIEDFKELVAVGYDPKNGWSWMAPGRYNDTTPFSYDYRESFKSVNSREYDKTTGKHLYDPEAPNWPLWKNNSSKELKNFGAYIEDEDKRNSSYYSSPSFFSDEQIFSTYHDGIMELYLSLIDARIKEGYPIGLQFEQNIYTWKEGDLKDAMIISYKCINISKDTLFDCWFAPVVDFDLADINDPHEGATNDRAKYFEDNDGSDMVIAWTDTTKGEGGKKFGYLGMSLIETPAVDGSGYLRKDKDVYSEEEQLGLVSCSIWPLYHDAEDARLRYQYISSGNISVVNDPGDYRIMMSSGPFHMLPGDTVKISYLINFAMPSKGYEADGSEEDFYGLVAGKKIAEGLWRQKMNPVNENKYLNSNNFKVLPNPANSSAQLEYNFSEPGYYSVDLYNIRGEQIISLCSNKFFDTGNGILDIDLSDIIPGIYYICFKNDTRIISRTVIVN